MKPAYVLFALVLGADAYFYQAGGWNQNSRFDLARAIVEKGTSRIDAFAGNTGDKSEKGGHFYCDKAPGISWMAVPPYAAVRRAVPLAWAAWLATVFAVVLPSALACVFFADLLVAWGVGEGLAVAAAAAWAFATLAWPYGTLLYGHQTAASLLLMAFALVAISRARGETAGPGRLAAAGFLLGSSVVVEYPAALAGLVVFLYALRLYGRRSGWILPGAAPPAAALAAYQAIVFGSALTTPYAFSTQGRRSQGFFMGIGTPDPRTLGHILFSDYRGLFFSAPWLLLAIPGAVRLWRRGRRSEVAVCGAVAILFIWLNASLVDWNGGWAMGPRYLVPCLPFLALLAGGLLAGRLPRAVAALALVLVLYSGFAMLVGTAVRPEVNEDIRQPFQAFLYPRFFRGELAVSTQGIDDARSPANAPPQAWNLGQKLGLAGLASLFPLALWGCAGGALLAALVRARPPWKTLFSGIVIAAVVGSFLLQMARGVCPVP